MLTLNVNWIAVLIAAVASNALGFGWYMSLAKQWLGAQGKTSEQALGAAGGSVTPFIWSAACQLVMAYFLAVLTPQLFGATTVSSGVLTGIEMWVGFIATSMILNHRYQGQKWALTLIDGGYLLGVLILQGIIIGLFG
jgi:hypothetical protein